MGKKLSKVDQKNQKKNNKPTEIFLKYYYKGNRKYLNLSNANYLYPIDDNESDRIQENHYIYREVWGNNFSAPIEGLLNSDDTKVLDIGCGPATWTLEMATEYPKAKFTGVDIVPTFPIRVKPNNVEFLQANLLTGLPYKDNTFDYVICKLMMFVFTVKDWEIAIKEICRVCKVGGYIEFMEKDVFFWNEGDFTRNIRSTFVEEMRRKKKIETIISPKIPQYISQTRQFPIIYHAERKVPIGEWGGKLGKSYASVYEWGVKNLKYMMKDCGHSDKEWDSIIEQCLKDLIINHGYDKVHRFWAKKEEFLHEE